MASSSSINVADKINNSSAIPAINSSIVAIPAVDPQHKADMFLRAFNRMAEQGHTKLAASLCGLCRATRVDDNMWDAISLGQREQRAPKLTRLQYALKTNDVARVRFLRAHAFWAEPYVLAGIRDFLPTFREMLPIIRESGFDFMADESIEYLVHGGYEVMRYVLETSPPGSQFNPNIGILVLDTVLPVQETAELMTFVLENGGDPNHIWTEGGYEYATSLLVVALTRMASLDVCRVIVRAGADVNFNIYPYQNLPLIYAVSRGLPFVKLLVEAGANLEGSQTGGTGESTALLGAIRAQDYDIIQYLLAIGADPDNPGSSLMMLRPMLVACSNSKNLQMVRMLIDAGAKVDQPALELTDMYRIRELEQMRWHRGALTQVEYEWRLIMNLLIWHGATW